MRLRFRVNERFLDGGGSNKECCLREIYSPYYIYWRERTSDQPEETRNFRGETYFLAFPGFVKRGEKGQGKWDGY